MSIFHPRKGQPYHEVNSLRGIDKGANARNRDGSPKYAEVDLDMQVTKDGRVVGTHWGRPLWRDGFRDPDRKIGRTRRIETLTYAEAHRLVAGDDYRIQPIEALLARCAQKHIGARLEPKSKAFYDPKVWRALKAEADKHGTKVKMYALRSHLGDRAFGEKCVRAAAAAGIKGVVIH